MRSVVSLLLIVLSLLAESGARADNVKPDFLVLRQNSHLILVGVQQQSTYEISDSEPLFCWEGRHSKATFTTSAEGVSIEFKLDIIGPDWLYVTLGESQEGLCLVVRRTAGNGADQDAESRWYIDYSSLLSDSEYGSTISALMRRYGQNPLLPEVACLRTACFGVEPPPAPRIEKECRTLIQQLNDDHWQIRDAAMQRLSDPAMVPYTLDCGRKMKLSAEQRLRIESIADRYQLEVSDSLLRPLASLVLSSNDVVSASD